jgi:hypothetical protein
MSTFKSRATGDVITVFGVLHDHYASRGDYEIVDDDRDGARDTAPQPEVLDDEPDEPDEHDTPDDLHTDPEGYRPEDSQDPDPAEDRSGNPRSTK